MVKLSSVETKSLGTVIEETLAPGIERTSQRRSNQAEVRYILDGEVEYTIADKVHAESAGATIYLPPGMASTLKSARGEEMVVFRTSGETDAGNPLGK